METTLLFREAGVYSDCLVCFLSSLYCSSVPPATGLGCFVRCAPAPRGLLAQRGRGGLAGTSFAPRRQARERQNSLGSCLTTCHRSQPPPGPAAQVPDAHFRVIRVNLSLSVTECLRHVFPVSVGLPWKRWCHGCHRASHLHLRNRRRASGGRWEALRTAPTAHAGGARGQEWSDASSSSPAAGCEPVSGPGPTQV